MWLFGNGRTPLDKLGGDAEKAIEWFAAEYKYLKDLKEDLEDIRKQEDVSKEKKGFEKAKKALYYVRKSERRSERAIVHVIKDLKSAFKKYPDLVHLENQIEVSSKQLLKAFSFYAGDFRSKLDKINENIDARKKWLKQGKLREAARVETEIRRLAESAEEYVDTLITWVTGLEASLKRVCMDTHMHSKASDGMWTPSEVVENAKKRGLDIIALTDHDTTYGVKEAMEKAKEIGMKVIPGIEIDAEFRKGKIIVQDIELLGLGVNLRKIQPFVDKIGDTRLQALGSYVDLFNEYITSDDFELENGKKKYKLKNVELLSVEKIVDWRQKRDKYVNPRPFLSKMDIVNYLLDKFVISMPDRVLALDGDRVKSGEFRNEYLFLFKTKKAKPTFYEAIEVVHNAGGKAVLAHPGLSKGYKGGMIKEWEKPEDQWFRSREFTPYKFVKDLKKHGLDGVEQYFYSGSDKSHAEAQDRINLYFRKVAEKLGLMITYGSDCHGKRGKGPLMGRFGSYKIIKELVP
jgi:3',5'-nucleoside bisphosphate phosphatase